MTATLHSDLPNPGDPLGPPGLSQLPAPGVRATKNRPGLAATAATLAGSIVAGVAFDVATFSAQIGVSSTVLVLVVVALLLGCRIVVNRSGQILLLGAATVAPWLMVRANATTTSINVTVILFAMVAAVALGTHRTAFSAHARAWIEPLGNLLMPAVTVWGFVWRGLAAVARRSGMTRLADGDRSRPVLRGLLLALPGVAFCAMLLASADSAFASLFGHFGDGAWVGHTIVAAIGATIFLMAAIAATTKVPDALVIERRRRHPAEAITLVGCYVALYSVFVISRLLSPPSTASATELSDAARTGFFQLVTVAGLTLMVLVWVRGRTDSTGALRWMIVAACALTLALVGIALHRLDSYRQRFGLTELRLSTTWFSWWLGLLFVLLAASTFMRLGRNRWSWVVAASALAWLSAWNVANTDARIAAANIERIPAKATSVSRDGFDSEFAMLLSDDAVPTIIEHFDRLPSNRQADFRSWICSGKQTAPTGRSWNAAVSAAADARRAFCEA